MQPQPQSPSSPTHSQDHNSEHESLKSKVFDYVPRWRTLENKHNECLDYLAIERTNLSWFLTAISVLSMGIAVSTCKYAHSNQLINFGNEFVPNQQLNTLHQTVLTKDTSDTLKNLFTAIGVIFIGFGLILIFYSFVRYWLVARKIMHGIFVRDRFSQPFITAFGICIGILALVVIFIRV